MPYDESVLPAGAYVVVCEGLLFLFRFMGIEENLIAASFSAVPCGFRTTDGF